MIRYAANLLAPEVCAAEKGVLVPKFEEEFLQDAGATELLPKWRKMAAAAMSPETKLVC
ncbi:MAG TPA: hypothetical protein VJX72_15610 [Candidatus Acidoferrum sp.]|nr:hypothetical protein [Candidatus Acidoferrum sp.]